MTGYLVLSNKTSNALLRKPEGIMFDEQIILATEEISFNPISYYIHNQGDKNLVVLTSPVDAREYAYILPKLDQYFEKKGIEDPAYLMGLKGTGITEQHIVTAYADPNKKIKIFDSKCSDAKKFFGLDEKKFLPFLRALGNSILPNPKDQIQIEGDNNNSYTVEFISLGTQSLFDPVSCGYHQAATSKICEKLFEEEKEITSEAILNRTGNPVSEGYGTIHRNNPNLVKVAYLDFLKQAWDDSVMPFVKEEERANTPFSQYFMGLPKENKSNQLLSMLYPIINLIRRSPVLLTNTVAQTANYFKNRLINWAPTSKPLQYLRSGLMGLTWGTWALFKGISLALSAVTSPIDFVKNLEKKPQDIKFVNQMSLLSEPGREKDFVDDDLSFTEEESIRNYSEPVVLNEVKLQINEYKENETNFKLK